ncbi:hypothetical protein [Allosediminivita pacifica]|uniref:Uncharacterized protein n=1 Tax=Allosediminivita pacifica TaxID=1267769 RepID=A0A2T6AY65_9RHOB|nr:hypothetical protein [Allosediminivita pacifica]PTX48750.1 hypothetical protein C8N44_10827 [Allosediminivita pacifica]GGB07918.1 hypothetical protein GCM10011324_17620 [Allosediminivita pacifica]
MLTGKTAPVSNVPGRPQKRTPKKQQQTHAVEERSEATETDAADPPAPPQALGGRLLREAWEDEKRPPAVSQAAQGYRKARGAVSTR